MPNRHRKTRHATSASRDDAITAILHTYRTRMRTSLRTLRVYANAATAPPPRRRTSCILSDLDIKHSRDPAAFDKAQFEALNGTKRTTAALQDLAKATPEASRCLEEFCFDAVLLEEFADCRFVELVETPDQAVNEIHRLFGLRTP